MSTGRIQVFCNRSVRFRHPKDNEVTHIVRNNTFEYAPDWIQDTATFQKLVAEKSIKIIRSSADLKETEITGKVMQKQLEEMEEDKIQVPVAEIKDEEDEDEEDIVEEAEEEKALEEMSNKKLYALCIEKGIEVEEKQKKSYYLEKLQ